MWRDLERICVREGLPFQRPASLSSEFTAAARVACRLTGDARENFSRMIYEAEFGRGLSIDAPGLIASILRELGLPADLLDRAASDQVKSALKASVEEAERIGHIRRALFRDVRW